MPRPTNKKELQTAADEQFTNMWSVIDKAADGERDIELVFSEEFLQKQKEAHWKRDKNLRDILIHLYEWHRLLIEWINANLGGDEKSFLPAPYNWKTYSQMNEEFFEKHQTTHYDDAKNMLRESHLEVMNLIERFSDDELFLKKHFSWTGTTSLGSYCVSATSSHYDWAIKKINKHIK